MEDIKTDQVDALKRAEELHRQLAEENKKTEELVKQIEKANVEAVLSGRSISNQQQPKQKRELTPKEAAAAFGKGVNLKDPLPLIDA